MTDSGSDQTVVQRLDKITFDYSATEDRLLARMLAADGSRSAIWLTQRLARQIVKVLCSHLAKIATGTHANSNIRSEQKQMILNFKRQAAMMKHVACPPVPEIETAEVPLLHTIHARLSQDLILLTLERPAGPAVLGLTQNHAWQFLQLLLNVFRRAEWAVDAWPDWMRNNEVAGAHTNLNNSRSMH